MKNQYFGDTRDLFKYDLALELLLQCNLRRLTFIPMLTRDKPNTHGCRTNYSKTTAGTRRVVLRRFLERCVKGERRNIRELEFFFEDGRLPTHIEFTIYRRENYFSHETRDQYFSAIRKDLLTRSLILVDPDIGFEVNSMKGREEKYIRYKEVKLLHDRMDPHSILMVFQFIPRVEREIYFSKISSLLKDEVNREHALRFVSDNQVVFFILVKSQKLQDRIEYTLQAYAKRYGLTTGKK